MKLGFKEDFIKIYQTERGILILMILNLLLSIALLVFSLINLNPNSAVVKIGYGDIGGYGRAQQGRRTTNATHEFFDTIHLACSLRFYFLIEVTMGSDPIAFFVKRRLSWSFPYYSNVTRNATE